MDAVRDVILNVHLKLPNPDLKLPAFDEALKPLQEWEDAATRALEDAARAAQEAADAAKHLGDALDDAEEAASAAAETAKEQAQRQLAVADAYNRSVEGAFTLANGLAAMNVVNQETAEEMIKTIAVFRGAFDVYKGGFEVLKGLTEVTILQSEVTKAATVVTTANTAAATANTAAMSRMAAVTTTASLALGGIVAIGTVAVLLWQSEQQAVERLGQALDDLYAKQRAAGQTRNATLGESLGFERALANLQELEARIPALGSQLESALGAQVSIGADLFSGVSSDLEAQAALGAAEEMAERNVVAIRAARDAATDLARARNEELASAEKVLQATQQQLTTTLALLRAEEARVDTLEQAVGRLSAVEEGELNRLLDNAEAGTLTAEGAERLGQLGGSAGQTLANQFFERRGEESDTTLRLLRLTGGDQLDELQGQIDQIGEGLGQGEGETVEQAMTRKLQELADARKLVTEEQNAILTELITRERDAAAQLRFFQAELDKLKAEA